MQASEGEESSWGAGSIRKKIQQWESLEELVPDRAAVTRKRPTLSQQSLRRLEETPPAAKNTPQETGQRSVNQTNSEEPRILQGTGTENGLQKETARHNKSAISLNSLKHGEVISFEIRRNVAETETAMTHQDDVKQVEAPTEIRVNHGGGETEVEAVAARRRKKAIVESGSELHAPELVALMRDSVVEVATNGDEVAIINSPAENREVADEDEERNIEDEPTDDWLFVDASECFESTEEKLPEPHAMIPDEPDKAETETNAGETPSEDDVEVESDSGRASSTDVDFADEEGEEEGNEDEIVYTTDMVGPCMMAPEYYDSESTASLSNITEAIETPSTLDYRKVKGHAALKPDWPDVKLTALLYLRGINTKRQFRLATSVEGAGSFGDIVFKYKTDDETFPSWKTCFIQLKHKGNVSITTESLTSVDGCFSLAEDYKSYCQIRDKMSRDTDEEVFTGSFDECTFVLHTNAVPAERLASRLRPRLIGDVEKLLKSGLNDDRTFCLGEESDKDIYSAMGTDKKDFLNKLVIFSAQPTEIEMDHLVKMELRAACSRYLSNVHIIYRFFVEAIQQWWADDPNYLTQKINVLDKAENILNVYNLSANQKHAFKLHEVSFREEYTDLWKAEIRKSNALLCIATTGMTSKFSCTKLMQVLREDNIEYIFTSLKALLQQDREVIREWTSGQKDLLVIVSEASSDEENELCQQLCQVLQKKPHKQLLVLSPPCNSFVTNLQLIFGCPYEEMFDPFDILQLDKDTTDQLLEREVRLQGYPIFLKCVIGEDLQQIGHILTSDNFDTLIDTNTINLGKPVHGGIHHYVKRTIERRDIIDLAILTSEDFTGVIAISNITINELQALVPEGNKVGQASEPNINAYRCLVLDSFNPAEDFAKLCETCNDVHWLHRSKDKLLWKRSQRDVASLASYKQEVGTRYQPEHVLDLEDRVVIVVADAGEGRTTLTTHLASETKQNDPAMWVIKADLSECVGFLENTSEEDFNAVEFLSSLENEDADFLGIDILSFCVERLGNVAVFLDGFDDVVPKYLEKVLALLSSLVGTKIKKIFITCERSMKDLLESRLSTLAYRLCPEERVKIVIEENARESFV